MKQIIVGIDFSVYSFRAMEYAIAIAGKLEAHITMVWVNKSGHQNDPGAENQLKELMNTFVGKAGAENISYKMAEGRIYLEISKLAEEIKADYIIVGVHGASGYDPFWLGSSAHRIITHAPCPVITVNKNTNVSGKIAKILLPIDNSEDTRQKVPAAVDFAKHFQATIVILGIFTTNAEHLVSEGKAYINSVKTFLDRQNVPYEYAEIHHEKYAKSVLDYAGENSIDMIVTISVQEAEETVMLGKNDFKIIHKSEIPVINIHSKLINPLAYSNVIGGYD